MKNLKQVKEVSYINQFIAVMDFLKAMGYETSELNVMEVNYLHGDITKAIENCEDPYSKFMKLDDRESIICPGCSNTFCECE